MRNYDEIKNIKLIDSQKTIGEFLVELFSDLWAKGINFNAKRPYGSSGWKYDIYAALAAANVIHGVIDEDGCVSEINMIEADAIIIGVIKNSFGVFLQ